MLDWFIIDFSHNDHFYSVHTYVVKKLRSENALQ